MGLEQTINYHLNKYPGIKKTIKRIYQKAMYLLSPKIKSEGCIVRLSPQDPSNEYFFGYYDKSPWDASDRYVLCLRAKNTTREVSPKETADILLIDTQKSSTNDAHIIKLAQTHTWNVQQGCMLQWLGPDFASKIIYNDFRQGKYISVILDIHTWKEQIINMPVYAVSPDGKIALTLDFSRLYNLRPGYGYYNVPELTRNIPLPDTPAVWKINLTNGHIIPLLTYTDFANFSPRPEMQTPNAIHKVNHIMISPNSKRFMVLYRWLVGTRKYTRLITCNIEGKDMYLLSDDDMVSHCCWKNNDQILAYENKKRTGPGYYLMDDKTNTYRHCWPQLKGDGHPSYSPTGKYIITDSYPDRIRVQHLCIMPSEEATPQIIAKVFSPFKYDNDTRCDLHPRWNRIGDAICFDSTFEGKRGLYRIEVRL